MMMLKKLVPLSCIVAAALGGCMAPSAPPDSLSGVVFEETFKTPEAAARVSGAEFVPGGGPGGQNSIRVKGGDRPAEMKLDASKLRGRLVTVEAMVKGQDLSGTLQIVPDYIQGPGEYYPSRGGDRQLRLAQIRVFGPDSGLCRRSQTPVRTRRQIGRRRICGREADAGSGSLPLHLYQ